MPQWLNEEVHFVRIAVIGYSGHSAFAEPESGALGTNWRGRTKCAIIAPEAEAFQWMYDEMTRAPEVIACAILIYQGLREYQDALWGLSYSDAHLRGKPQCPATRGPGADRLTRAERTTRDHRGQWPLSLPRGSGTFQHRD